MTPHTYMWRSWGAAAVSTAIMTGCLIAWSTHRDIGWLALATASAATAVVSVFYGLAWRIFVNFNQASPIPGTGLGDSAPMKVRAVARPATPLVGAGHSHDIDGRRW